MKMYQSHLYPADAVMCDLSKLQVYPKDEKDRPPLPPRRGALVDSDAVRDALNDLGSTFSLTSISADVDNYSVFALSGEEFDVVTKQQYTSTQHLMPPSSSRYSSTPHLLSPDPREIQELDAKMVFQSVLNPQTDSSLPRTWLEREIKGHETQLKVDSEKELSAKSSPTQQEEEISHTHVAHEDDKPAEKNSAGASDQRDKPGASVGFKANLNYHNEAQGVLSWHKQPCEQLYRFFIN